MTRLWLCPGGTDVAPCLQPLPCAEHHIADPFMGWTLTGNAYMTDAPHEETR